MLNRPDIRAGAHTDYGSITLLFQHRVPGLQVHRDGSWLDVAPQEGCIVINIGDALEFWTGGRFRVCAKIGKVLTSVDPS